MVDAPRPRQRDNPELRMNDPVVSVIIPARDAAPTLARTLEALQAQKTALAFEVIVVDDGSRDQTRAIAERFANFVSVVPSSGEGPGAARNRGVRAARAPVLAFTDADCFPTSEWLEHGYRALEDADLVQGRVLPDPNTPRTPFDRSLWVKSDHGFYQTANLFVRREIFEAVGGFRDRALEQDGRRRWSVDRRRGRATRTPIGEDTLFAWTALRRGARSAFAPDALVYHEVVPGGVRDAAADRWHWTRDMPGLVRHVPELRRTTFYRRVFFGYWTAYFDLAAAGVAAALITRRGVWIGAALPYLRRLQQDSAAYDFSEREPASRVRGAVTYALGSAVVDGVTLGGFLAGSIAWRRVVL